MQPLLLLSLFFQVVVPTKAFVYPLLTHFNNKYKHPLKMTEEQETSTTFVNASATGEIPSFNGDEKAKATDFANYFCSYAQLYHQKQMLTGK